MIIFTVATAEDWISLCFEVHLQPEFPSLGHLTSSQQCKSTRLISIKAWICILDVSMSSLQSTFPILASTSAKILTHQPENPDHPNYCMMQFSNKKQKHNQKRFKMSAYTKEVPWSIKQNNRKIVISSDWKESLELREKKQLGQTTACLLYIKPDCL